MATHSEDSSSTQNDPVVTEAQERLERCLSAEDGCRKNWLNDYKFANADAYNGYQWPQNIKEDRDLDERPCLTINKTRQHCLQIINDAKKNKPGMKFRPTGGGASYASAQMYDALGRHIEYQSHATDAYDQATAFMVQAGFGWLRLKTDFVDDDSWDQEIYIAGEPDPLSVYLDCDAVEVDKSDANYGFKIKKYSKETFKKKWPNYMEYATQEPLPGVSVWLGDDYVLVCEYYRRVEKKDTIYAVPHGENGETGILRESSLKSADPKLLESLKLQVKSGEVKSRAVVGYEVEYYMIAGNKLIKEENAIWPGKYIPFVLVYAEETQIEGKLDRKSHTRALIDPQRMYNYWSSAAVEYGALQGKTPWITAIEAVEGYETYWATANRINHAYLPYNGLDDAGNKIAAPQRTEPPVAAPVCLEGMKIAQLEMMLVSGQYESSMGQGSNERTGKAINAREAQGDNANFHFINGMAVALRNVGRQVIDLAPKVYDTKRILQIQAEDGTQFEMIVDPKAGEALQKRQAGSAEVAQHVFNPGVGKYEVEADIGPNYGTKRMETWNALTLLLTQAPQLTSIVGDLLLRSGDFHLADEAAERLRRMVPAYALGEGPTQSEQQLQGQITNLTGLLAKAMEELSLEKIKYKGKEQARDIDVFDALTKRIKVLVDAQKGGADGEGGGKLDASALTAMVAQAVQETLGTSLQPVIDANEPAHEAAAADGQLQLPGMHPGKPPVPGAKLGLNGNWYLRDAAAQKNLTPIA